MAYRLLTRSVSFASICPMDKEIDIKSEVYEFGFLLVPEVGDEGAPASFSALKGMIEEVGGQTISDSLPAKMALAYPMDKEIDHKHQSYKEAYFGWIKFELEKNKIEGLKAKFDAEQTLIRFLIIKTVKENTLAPKKLKEKMESTGGRRHSHREEAALPMNKEEVDKQIDALVSDEKEAEVKVEEAV